MNSWAYRHRPHDDVDLFPGGDPGSDFGVEGAEVVLRVATRAHCRRWPIPSRGRRPRPENSSQQVFQYVGVVRLIWIGGREQEFQCNQRRSGDRYGHGRRARLRRVRRAGRGDGNRGIAVTFGA